MLLDCITQESPNQAKDQNRCHLQNFYMEEEQTTKLSQYPYQFTKDPPKGEYKYVLYPTPGLTLWVTLPTSPVRAMIEQDGVNYAVSGNTLYSIGSDGTITALATLNTSTGPVKMVAITGGIDSNNQLIMIDGTNGYSYNIGTATADFPIADPSFPQTARDIITIDDVVVALPSDSMGYYYSDPADSTTWSALSFESKYGQPDRITALSAYMDNLWTIGTKTTQVWTDVGIGGISQTAQFQKTPGLWAEVGCIAQTVQSTAVIIQGSLTFLGRTRHGGYQIIQFGAPTQSVYAAENIATKPIMELINSFSTVLDAFAYGYEKNGHSFYEITFPTANVTLTYDDSNFSWLVRSSYINGAYGKFLGSCQSFCYEKNLIGDSQSGNIYYQDSTNNTENGTPIQRQFVSSHIYLGGNYFSVNYLQIDVETNIGNGTFLLEVSQDHGQTWTTVNTYTIPTSGSQIIRVPSLGGGRVFTLRLTTTSNVPLTILGFQADVSPSVW